MLRKMAKLHKNLSDRQIGLMRCLEQFENVHNQLTSDLGCIEQPQKDCLNKFNYSKYAFELSAFFAKEIKKIEDKINSLKLIVKKQEEKGVQVMCS